MLQGYVCLSHSFPLFHIYFKSKRSLTKHEVKRLLVLSFLSTCQFKQKHTPSSFHS